MSYHRSLIQSGSSYLPLTSAWILATGESDLTILGALNTLETNGIANGWLVKRKALYPIVGGNSTKHSFNFINTALYQLSFSSGWTHTSGGMQGNGISSYANTGIVPSSVLDLNNTSVSSYSRSDLSENSALIGVSSGATDEISIFPSYGGTTMYYAINGSEPSVANTDSSGFFLANRMASNLLNVWRNSTKLAETSSASVALSTHSLYIGAYNNIGATQYCSSHIIAFTSVGEGLSDAEEALMYADIQAFQTTLSRQV